MTEIPAWKLAGLVCPICQVKYTPARQNQLCCGNVECRKELRKIRELKPVDKTERECINCHVKFVPRTNSQRRCGADCWTVVYEDRVCANPICRETFTPKGRNAYKMKYCSPDCGQRGEIFSSHNLTPEQYGELWDIQEGKCIGCGGTSSRKGSKLPLHIDHDHSCCPGQKSCGKCVRGLVCFTCNLAMGNTSDNFRTLLNLATYLMNYEHQKMKSQFGPLKFVQK